MLHAVASLILTAVAPQASCAPGVDIALAELNFARLSRGAAPLQTHPALCETAAERAADILANEGTNQGVSAINRRTRSLYRKGYAAHAWSEAAIIGGGNEAVLEQFRQVRPDWYREALDGDYQEIGAAASRLRSRPVYAMLLALPRWAVEWRQAEPLGDLAAVHQTMLDAVNGVRTTHQRDIVSLDEALSAAAQAHAADMLRRVFYAHRSPEGTSPRDRAEAAGYHRRGAVGENIAKGPFTPSEVVERWMNSSGHRRNILRPGNRVMGVGVAFGENANGFEVVWVQLFAGE